MKISRLILTAVVLLSFQLHSFAWDNQAHKITGTVALNFLDQKAKDSLSVYLGGMSMQDATVWMDLVKGDQAYEYLRGLHYINFEKGTEYVPDGKNNIVTELNRVIAELKERNKYSKEQIALDLKILCHLMGDLHQPFHVGYAADRGGNNIQVTVLGQRTTLHKAGDVIIEQYNIAAVDCIKKLSKYSKADIDKLQNTDIVAWMKETRANLPAAYDFTKGEIDADYCERRKPVIETELGLSGLRLAHILNELFAN